MKTFLMNVSLILCVEFSLANAQTPKGTVVRLEPALDAIVSPDARLEILKDDYFGLAEGPLWIKEGPSGYLVFSDIGANSIFKWTPDGKLSVLLERTGYSGQNPSAELGTLGYISSGTNGRLWTVSFGSNGIAVDKEGRLVWTAQGDRAIIRQEKDGRRTVLADRFESKRLNRPNDVVVKSDGWMYFTDPWGKRPGVELDFAGLYRVKEPGTLQLLDKNPNINGLVFSPDEKYLYVGGGARITRYDVRADGTLTNAHPFVTTNGCDGMKVDTKANLFCASNGVQIYNPEGKHLGTIRVPDNRGGLTNLAFGDPDGKSLYLTLKGTLAKIRLKTAGW